jgi:hypothetical protein
MATQSPTITARYQGTIGGQLRYVPVLNRGSKASILLSLACIVLALLSLPDIFFATLGVVLSVLILSGYYLIPFAWWTLRRNRWLFEAPVEMIASREGLEFKTAAGPTEIGWPAVGRGRELRDVFAVMLRTGGGYCIPKSALEGGDLDAFRDLLEEFVPFRRG